MVETGFEALGTREEEHCFCIHAPLQDCLDVIMFLAVITDLALTDAHTNTHTRTHTHTRTYRCTHKPVQTHIHKHQHTHTIPHTYTYVDM